MRINTASLGNAQREVNQLASQVRGAAGDTYQTGLGQDYSAEPSLGILGLEHGAALNAGPGSAQGVLHTLANQIAWIGHALGGSGDAIIAQERLNTRALERADEGVPGASHPVAIPPRPVGVNGPVVFTPPVMMFPVIFPQLVSRFATAQVADPASAARIWMSMARQVDAAATGLAVVAGRLRAENSGEVIDAAARQIQAASIAARSFVPKAQIMATHVPRLNVAYTAGAAKVNAAAAAFAAIADPAARSAAETAFVTEFAAFFTPLAATAIPPVTSLMDMDVLHGGGGLIDARMQSVRDSGYDEHADITPEGITRAVFEQVSPHWNGDLSNAPNLGKAGRAAVIQAMETLPPEVSEIMGGKALSDVTTAPSAVQSLAPAPSAPSPAGGMSALPQSSGPLGQHPLGLPGGHATPGAGSSSGGVIPALNAGRSGGVNPLGLGGYGAAPGSSTGGARGVTSPASLAALGVRPDLSGLNGAVGEAGPGLRGAGASLSGLGRLGNSSGGTGAASSLGGALYGGTSSGRAGVPGFGPLPSGGAGPSSLGAGYASGAGGLRGGLPGAGPAGMTGATSAPGAAGGRGMMPVMGGTGPAGAQPAGQKRRGKIRTVTSQVEESANLRALLGERPPVVPGVIGEWVRS